MHWRTIDGLDGYLTVTFRGGLVLRVVGRYALLSYRGEVVAVREVGRGRG